MTEDAAIANIYIEIMNNPTLLHRMFRGLFASARIYHGHKPNCHQYLFETEILFHFNYPLEKIAGFEKQGIVVVPYAGKDSQDHLVLTCKSMRDPQINSLYAESLKSLRQKGFDENKLKILRQTFNHIKFAKFIVGMYWFDMVVFAKNNTQYSKDWQL